MANAASIALVLHPRRDPGPVLDAVGSWAASHGSRLLMRAEDASDLHQRRNQVKLSLLDLPFLPDELRELATPGSRALEPPADA